MNIGRTVQIQEPSPVIVVICALAEELAGFADPEIDVVAVGVGPVEAAIGTVRALAAKPYRLAINAGIGGGFAGQVRVGEAVTVTAEHYVELGREDRADLTLPGGLALETRCRADSALLERYRARASAGTRFGIGVTSATITTTASRAAELAARYAPASESMEGFAVLRAAAVAGVAAVELRGISNIVGDRAASQWDFRAGSAAAVRALERFVSVVKADV